MNFLLYVLLYVALVLTTGWFIRDTIVHYKAREYFLCGINIALAITTLCNLVKLIF